MMRPLSIRVIQCSLTFVVFAILSVVLRCDAVLESLASTRQSCDREGAIVKVAEITNAKCFNCICKNGFVECAKQQCPSMDGCHAVIGPQDDKCCQRCKGCMMNGAEYQSGTEWTDSDDPCTIYNCNAGVITESRLRCHEPCANPIPAAPEQCCPACAGCAVPGLNLAMEKKVVAMNNPSISCSCNDGRYTCTEKACPVLNCEASKIRHEYGRGCSYCKGHRQVPTLSNGACMLGTTRHDSGAEFNVDNCTRCRCTASYIFCVKETCPVLTCASRRQMTSPGQCCSQCSHLEMVHGSCTHEGRSYQNGDSWKLDRCGSCKCVRGKVRCTKPTCPPLRASCRLEHSEDSCCPRCVDDHGVCTVFGDPHYKTFDGKFFTFNGPCRYQLVSDCTDRTFSIRVTNEKKSSSSSSRTKTVVVKIGDSRVVLGRRMRIKVNGTKVRVPYSLANILEINRTSDSVSVSTQIGIKVSWDGISLIEVSASNSFRDRLCGLCGNFNSLPDDDFTTRRGRLVIDPQEFGNSWAVATKKMCPLTRSDNGKERDDTKLCDRLRSKVFKTCNKKVDTRIYYESCIEDMTECPNKHCFCWSFVAYAHECQRRGVQLSEWRNITGCRAV